jgi:hypothetical protein
VSALFAGLLVLWAQAPDGNDPFAYVVNALYNPQFAPAAELLPDAYAGPVPASTGACVIPGWFADAGTRASLDEAVSATPPRSLRFEEPRRPQSVASYALAVDPAALVVARAKVMVEGDVRGACIALRWQMADGSLRRTASPPPTKERDFVEVRLATRPPEGARTVALVLECAGNLAACRFDDPVLGMVGPELSIAAFPTGCHPRGLREALIKARLPLVKPVARVTWGDQGKSIEVHPLQTHASGIYYYALDLMLFDAPGDYTLEVRDNAFEGRTARARTAILTDPYGPLEAKAEAYVRASFTAAREGARPPRTAAEDIILFAALPSPSAARQLAEVARALVPRVENAASLRTDELAYCAWALAAAGDAAGDAPLLARARALTRSALKREDWHTTPTRAALCGAAVILSAHEDDGIDRDCADDAAGELVGSARLSGGFPYAADVAEQSWPVLALAAYARSFPDTALAAKAQSALDACVGRIERLCAATPFGNARAADGEDREVDLPAWTQGTTLYLLSLAASMCANARADAADRLRMHTERQLQFLLGFNPLGKALDLEKGESLRASAGERLRPGEVIYAEPVDPLRAHLYLRYAAASVRSGLKEAERLYQEYERARKEKQEKQDAQSTRRR